MEMQQSLQIMNHKNREMNEPTPHSETSAKDLSDRD